MRKHPITVTHVSLTHFKHESEIGVNHFYGFDRIKIFLPVKKMKCGQSVACKVFQRTFSTHT